MNIKETIRRILREDKYSPAGKEIIPNSIVVHKSNPIFRDNIMSEGLKVKDGECYKIYVGYGTKCKPAIFATNSINERAWFDSTYDDDIWEINTEMIPDVKWYKDRHFESTKKHIVTFQNIPSEALTLKYEGTGGDMIRESKFFRRRIDLDEVKWLLSINAEQVFGETSSFDQFKYEVTLRAVESIMWNEYNIGWEDLPEQEEIDFVTEVSDMFEDIIIDLYKHIRGKYNRFEWKT